MFVFDLVILLGSLIFFNPLQLLKANASIISTLSGISMKLRFSQPAKAASPILVMLPVNCIDSNPELRENARLPIL